MAAKVLNIEIEQGATFSNELTLTDGDDNPIDLTGYQVRSKIKKTPGCSDTIASFTLTLNDPATDGKINWSLPPSASNAIDVSDSKNFKPLEYFYDLEIESPQGIITRVFQGMAKIIPNVTR